MDEHVLEKMLDETPEKKPEAPKALKIESSVHANASCAAEPPMADPDDTDASMQTGECCCHKKKVRDPDEAQALINRLSRIEGQIRGIRSMVERDCYCTDILTQVAAVRAALGSFNKALLAEHIRTCVAQDIREGRDETIDELVITLQKLMK